MDPSYKMSGEEQVIYLRATAIELRLSGHNWYANAYSRKADELDERIKANARIRTV